VECGYFVEGTKPPDTCGGCRSHCSFTDVTCYRPECGGPASADPMVMNLIAQKIGKMPAPLRPVQQEKTAEVVYAEKVTKDSLFQGLNDKEIKQVLGIGELRTYQPDEFVFREGEEAKHIYIVDEGKLKVISPEKEELYDASAGDILGWSALMLPFTRTASAVAAEKSRVHVIEGERFQEFCEKNPSIGYKITRNTGRIIAVRMRNARAMSADLVYG